jgi:hypothetical protein
VDAMSAPQNFQVRDLLAEIRDLFGSLCAMTKRLLEDFSPEALEETLKKRSLVLCRIDAQKATLCGISGPSSWAGYEQFHEIQERIGDCTNLDRDLTVEVSHRMYAIKRELAALSETSHVAQTYARHCRR